jgi:hypothetical protein
MPGIDISVSGIGKLDDITRAMAIENEDIPRELKNSIKDSAGTLGDRASLRVILEPTHGLKHTGLRARVAKGVGLQELPDGYRVTTSMPNANEAAIPRGMDQHGWRHPVFGNKGTWVVEGITDFSWFMDTMQEGEDLVGNGLEQQLENAAERIDNAGRA